MENKKIIDELYFCAAQCAYCYNGCQMEKEKDEFTTCMAYDKDCEDICRLTAQFIERNSDNSELLLKICGEICQKCAAECEKHSHLEHCMKCAEACKKCADICEEQQIAHQV